MLQTRTAARGNRGQLSDHRRWKEACEGN